MGVGDQKARGEFGAGVVRNQSMGEIASWLTPQRLSRGKSMTVIFLLLQRFFRLFSTLTTSQRLLCECTIMDRIGSPEYPKNGYTKTGTGCRAWCLKSVAQHRRERAGCSQAIGRR